MITLYFNPRTHEECDCEWIKGSRSWWYFNPRTHEECDGTSTNNAAFSNNISIHALTRSATIIDTFRVVIVWDFNPRTHEECDKFAFNAVLSPFNFNPRTHEECD